MEQTRAVNLRREQHVIDRQTDQLLTACIVIHPMVFLCRNIFSWPKWLLFCELTGVNETVMLGWSVLLSDWPWLLTGHRSVSVTEH